MNECSAYVGPDVHKDTIAVAVALLPGCTGRVSRGYVGAGRGAPHGLSNLHFRPRFPRDRLRRRIRHVPDAE